MAFGLESQAWREFLTETVPAELTAAIRQNTHTGRPLGSPGFVRGLEITLRRRLTPDKGGRPPKEGVSLTQQAFPLDTTNEHGYVPSAPRFPPRFP